MKSKFNQWFETFLAEKELPIASWEIQDASGMVHFIDSEVVIEAIKGFSASEQDQVKAIIVKIDFINGEVNHFFGHLAKGLVANFAG